MLDIVRIRLIRPRLWSIAPPDSPTPADADPSLDTAVLEVGGGYLSWSLLADQRVPAATLHDLDTAQEWLWALYGAEIAVAADEYTGPVDMPARPERPELAAAVHRLGYAHWAARWWPASTVDGIPALDPAELDREIAELSEFCDSVVDGSDAPAEAADPDPAVASAHGSGLGRAADYALAAGGQPRDSRTALILERGSAGWDWRHCPPGVVDASERAVSWELERVAGGNTLRVRVVAAPGLHGEPPEHLRPRALVRTSAGTRGAALVLNGDTWTAAVPDSGETVTGVEIYVPGVGPSAPGGSGPSPDPDPRPADPAADARQRDRIRELAHARLRRAGPTAVAVAYAAGEPAAGLADIELLRAEITAAEGDSDF